MKYRILATTLVLSFLMVGCADDTDDGDSRVTVNSETGDDAGADAGPDSSDADESEDASPHVEYDPRCGDAPIDDWPLHDELADGEVNSSGNAEARTFEIDANAGGYQQASSNPFVYVNLGTGERVDITDIEAFERTDWDLAFRRTAIRTNSGDSGPGDVSLAQLNDTSFGEVDSAPSDESEYFQDVSYDEECEPITDPIGMLYTAFNYVNTGSPSGSWYDYFETEVISPDGIIYIVDVPTRDTTYKLEIDTWEDGVYTIHVGEL